jgi:hypothetical protein
MLTEFDYEFSVKIFFNSHRINLRSSAQKSAKICGKRFSALNLFKVRDSFPADFRRSQRRLAQIFIPPILQTQYLKP